MATVTQAVEDYLKTIWRLSRRDGERVPVGDIAADLAVSAPSVTGMVQKLQAMGLVHYARYDGVRLSPKGRKIALEIVRHHRLWELYLHTRLGVPLDRVDSEAERLEHVLSDDMEDLLSQALGEPTHDPHGDPIPTKQGVLGTVRGEPLLRLEPGRSAIVTHVSDRDAAMLRYLVTLGLVPGARVAVVERAPFGGPLTVRIGRRRFALDPSLAERVRVEPHAKRRSKSS
ncbi:MAG TPA: metal-dependent transcriptional regulator [Candidatus Eisenbacteria bacterium]|nr:metal-dependent transcriptional regulator [Candidatus Eisenbacteria bacterium]